MSNNKFKILIVEDEANILSFIKANLEISDYQVICAETLSLSLIHICKNPGMKDILEVAKNLSMNLKLAEDIAQQVQACVEDDLGEILSKRF